jgi:hypothetical protein
MAGPFYKVYMGRALTSWYQLSAEERTSRARETVQAAPATEAMMGCDGPSYGLRFERKARLCGRRGRNSDREGANAGQRPVMPERRETLERACSTIAAFNERQQVRQSDA